MYKPILTSLLALISITSCGAQVLSHSEHTDLLKRLDLSTSDWQQRVESLDIDKLNVSYSVGKNLEKEKDIILKNLQFMHKAIAQQLVHESLSTDISLESSLTDVMNFSASLVDSLPENAEGVHWAHIAPNPKEFEPFAAPLMQHILATADRVEEKAEKCSR